MAAATKTASTSEAKPAPKSGTVGVTQVRSAIGATPKQDATLASLGLGRIGKRTERADTPQLRGQLRVISHLVEIREAS